MKRKNFLPFLGMFILTACTTLPTIHHPKYTFPKSVFMKRPGGMDSSQALKPGQIVNGKNPYEVLGVVKSKVNFPTLDMDKSEESLCRNYFNKAVHQLLEYARKNGGDAVIDVKSVVFLVDGRQETYSTPECSDDGDEGQILTQGVAIRWLEIPPTVKTQQTMRN